MLNKYVKYNAAGLIVHLIASQFLILYFYNGGGTRLEAFPIHATLLITIFILVFSLWLFLLKLFKNNLWIKPVYVCSYLILSVWLILVYTSSLFGYLFWSNKVPVSALFSYLPALNIYLNQAGIWHLFLTWSAIIIFSLIAFWIIWARQLSKHFETLILLLPTISINKVLLPVFLLSLTVLLSFILAVKMDRMKSLRSEPFSNYFRNSDVISLTHKSTVVDVERHINAKNDFQANLPQLQDTLNVVVIMVDAVRADHMSLYGYQRKTTPFLDSLQKSGNLVKVDLATSTCTDSTCGITSMLSSQFFSKVHHVNYKLNDALKDIGYTINFLLSGDHSRAYNYMKSYYGSNVDIFRDGFSFSGRYSSDDKYIIRYLNDLKDFDEAGQSFFYFHLMSAHFGGMKENEFSRFLPYDYTLANEFLNRSRNHNFTDDEFEALINSYDNGILQADNYIKRIFETLDKKGYLENSIVAIASDHGEAFGENGFWAHGGDIHSAEIVIPLLFYTSTKQKTKNNIPYGTLIDIPPTLFGFLGIKSPSSWEGVNLMEVTRDYSHHLSTSIDGSNATIIRNDNEYFLFKRNRNTKKEEFVNLSQDPYKVISSENFNVTEILEKAIIIHNKEFNDK